MSFTSGCALEGRSFLEVIINHPLKMLLSWQRELNLQF